MYQKIIFALCLLSVSSDVCASKSSRSASKSSSSSRSQSENRSLSRGQDSLSAPEDAQGAIGLQDIQQLPVKAAELDANPENQLKILNTKTESDRETQNKVEVLKLEIKLQRQKGKTAREKRKTQEAIETAKVEMLRMLLKPDQLSILSEKRHGLKMILRAQGQENEPTVNPVNVDGDDRGSVTRDGSIFSNRV